jgi:hypothetical protein
MKVEFWSDKQHTCRSAGKENGKVGRKFTHNQCDQIGRNLAIWVIIIYVKN